MSPHMDELAVFRKMLEPENWPVKPGDYILIEGELYTFMSDDPLEERICKVLRSGRFQ
jgi:hypothetical protein